VATHAYRKGSLEPVPHPACLKPEVVGSMCLQIVGICLQDYTVSQSSRAIAHFPFLAQLQAPTYNYLLLGGKYSVTENHTIFFLNDLQTAADVVCESLFVSC
jgi:hypothetical protein